MKKALICLLVIFISFSLYAEIYKSTTEIRAYKEIGSVTPPPQEEVTLTLLGPDDSQFGDGFNIAIPEENRNNAYTAFYWMLSGNCYHRVTLTFSFGPMTLGAPSDSPSMIINDKTTVIPYTVQLSHMQTSVTSGNTTRTIGTTIINSADSSTAFDSGINYSYFLSSYDVYINYADSVSVDSSRTVSTSSVSNMSVAYNLSTNSYAWYGRYSKSKYNGAISTCNDWVRKGKADVTLKIDEDGTWTVDDTSVLINGGTYKAFVKVEVSVE